MAKAKITRIKANDSKKLETKAEEPTITRKKVVIKDKKSEKANKKEAKKVEKAEKKAKDEGKKKPFILFRPFCAFGRYLKESWQEIRQVRWPNRKATWKMVLAVIIYTAIFLVFILLLDLLFQFLSNTIFN